MEPVITLNLHMLDSAFAHEGWHGASLVPTLRKLSLEQLTDSDTYEGYTAWGIALHCAYWKYRARRRLIEIVLAEEPPKRFERSPADWPDLPAERTRETWKRDLELLRNEHQLLKDVVSRLSVKLLVSPSPKTRKPMAGLIYGVAAHDAYHTAQIRNMGLL